MKKSALIISMLFLLLSFSCKVSESVVDNFRVLSVSGYSLQDSGSQGLTSINLFFSIKNTGTVKGKIKYWKFKLMRNIVTLLEINSDNFKDYNLESSESLTIPPENILEFFVNTPLPFDTNAIEKSKLPFNTYTPDSVMLEVTIEDDNGDEFLISKSGSYIFEKGIVDSDQYNILGNWKFTKTINGETKPDQKISFVGTKVSGNFVIYNLISGKAESTGTFTVAGVKNITLRSTDGTKYWGEFSDTDEIKGTLLKGTSTGTWIAEKM